MEDKTYTPILKVGDKVRINSKEWYNNNKDDKGEIVRNSLIFNSLMKEYCGKVFTIDYSYEKCGHIYYLFMENDYAWGSWMFSPVKEPTNNDYQVGDRVQINSLKWYNQTKDDSGNVEYSLDSVFDKEKAKYCGDLATIIAISTRSDGNHYYGFKEIPFIWMSWMFSSAEWSLLPSMKMSTFESVEIGDEILTIYGTKGVILDVSTIYKTFLVTYDDYSEGMWMGYDYINSVLEHGKYKDYIDTSESNWTLRRCDFRDKLKQLEISTSTVDEDKIEVGDLVTNKDKIQYVIAENLSESNYYYALDVEHWNAIAINKKDSLVIVEKGKYKDLINTKLPVGTIARQLRNRFGIITKCEDMRKELKNGTKKHFIREPRTGDTIKSPYFNGIIIGKSDDKDSFLILTTPDFDKHWLDKDDITEIDGYGRYLYHIDTNEFDLDIRADKLRKYFMSSDYYTEKVTTSEEQLSNNKDNDSQSNSSKFNLTKVIYKSRRIK